MVPLQFSLEPDERRRHRLGVFAHPAVVDEPDGNDVQEVQLLAAALLGRDETGLFEHLQVLHDAEARHRQARSEEHTSELQSRPHIVCRLLLEKKKKTHTTKYKHPKQNKTPTP